MANRSLCKVVAGFLLVAASSGALASPTKAGQIAAGKALYASNCSACHRADGSGVRGEVPPLAGSDFLAKGPEHAIAVVLHGLKGKLRVHGRAFDEAMPTQFHLTDEQIADVLTYVYNSWGNPGGRVKAGDVAAQRFDRALAPGKEHMR